jgi:2-polyprenyl-3-methyl-5-hydroxy-6-metoxy-1,4-benzoquinol methylase
MNDDGMNDDGMKMPKPKEPFDAVAAYDRIAPVYARLAEPRAEYLDAVERLIIDRIAPGSLSLLDVGAGDGVRALRIAAAAGLQDVTLLEPSEAMRRYFPADVTVWAMRAENLQSRQGSFEVITCLWNVLGHIAPAAARMEALRQFGRLLAPQGKVFIDVNHRYNARHYGTAITILRFLRDYLSQRNHGDVQVTWNIEKELVATTGHVFTHKEFLALSHAAGLRIDKRFVIDYSSGRICRRTWEGNLLYELRPL